MNNVLRRDDLRCDRPPDGWWCSREQGHDGPCAARRHSRSIDAETVLCWLVEGHKRNATLSKNDKLTEWQKDAYAAALKMLELPPDYLGHLDRPGSRTSDVREGNSASS